MMLGKLWFAVTLALWVAAVEAGDIRRPPAPARPIDESAPSVIEASDEELAGWFADLASHEFAVREQAESHLRQAGKSAVPLLASRLNHTDELEMIVRGLGLLGEMVRSRDQATRTAARVALRGLAKSDNRSVAQRAQATLNPPEVIDDDVAFRGRMRGNVRVRAVVLNVPIPPAEPPQPQTRPLTEKQRIRRALDETRKLAAQENIPTAELLPAIRHLEQTLAEYNRQHRE
ncbi:MAG TPA: hypothetical protein VHB77_18645 [Planctomycetaceae bacterium]|nr:hypothetical protein [Planctomycetaceae bacterium]